MPSVVSYRFDLVKDFRIVVGSDYQQKWRYYSAPDPGQAIGQIVSIDSATPTYTVKLFTGQILNSILSSDVTAWEIGDFVIVEDSLGVAGIVGPAVLEDISTVTRVHAQIRKNPGSAVLIDFDSENAGNTTLGRIALSPDAVTTMTWDLPAAKSIGIIPGAQYFYDCYFTYAAGPVQRQYGSVEIAPRITRDS